MTVTKDNNKVSRTAVLPPLRVTNAEREAIDEKARDAGISRSEYVRLACLNGGVVIRQNPLTVQAIRQLAAIGNNLNQLTRKAHIHGEHEQERLRDILNTIETQLADLI